MLQTIFQYIDNSAGTETEDYENKNLLNECQQVCRNWSIAAQESLYDRNILSGNSINFVVSIEECSRFGELVKIVEFTVGFADILTRIKSLVLSCTVVLIYKN